MTHLTLICTVLSLALCRGVIGGEPQPPMGAKGLSFRSDPYFAVADDFVRSTGDAITAVRWWGSLAEESAPHDTTPPAPFWIEFYTSVGGLPATPLASYSVAAAEAWTGGFCRGIEGFGASCPGPEPLYVYEVCLDPPFTPAAGTEYWIGISSQVLDEAHFWAWHEADVPHPAGHTAATLWCIIDCIWSPGLINDCPGDFTGWVWPYDTAFELLTTCPGTCPWDLDGDNNIGILDLLALLAAWGTDPGGPPDFDFDGTVGILDLLTLLANWGPCP